MPAGRLTAKSRPSSRPIYAITALLVAGATPWKEVALISAVLMLFLLPLNWQQIKAVMTRCWPILAMMAIAIIMTVIDVTGELDKRSVVRIAFYYLRIPVFILLGFAARRYIIDDRPVLWTIIALGVWGSGGTLFRYLTGGNVASLNHNEVRAIVGSGDSISMIVPLCALTLWPRARSNGTKAILGAATIFCILGVLAANSRTGLLIFLLSALFSLPQLKPLMIARWGSIVILVGTLVLTTPVFPPLLHFFDLDASNVKAIGEVIAHSRSDFQSINEEWRGYETYMAFAAAARDGIFALFLGHGFSVYAPLGVSIELAPGQFFNKTDVFHNGWSFIVLHSGIVGILLFIFQFFLIASKPKTPCSITLRRDNRLFGLNILSLAASTAVIAGAFNGETFASVQLFLIGCFYPYSLVPVPRRLRARVAEHPAPNFAGIASKPGLSVQG